MHQLFSPDQKTSTAASTDLKFHATPKKFVEKESNLFITFARKCWFLKAIFWRPPLFWEGSPKGAFSGWNLLGEFFREGSSGLLSFRERGPWGWNPFGLVFFWFRGFLFWGGGGGFMKIKPYEVKLGNTVDGNQKSGINSPVEVGSLSH